MINVQPLQIDYSFVASRKQATDLVNVEQLQTAVSVIVDKLNEIIDALNVTTADDNTLIDNAIEARHLSNDALEQITSIVRQETVQ